MDTLICKTVPVHIRADAESSTERRSRRSFGNVFDTDVISGGTMMGLRFLRERRRNAVFVFLRVMPSQPVITGHTRSQSTGILESSRGISVNVLTHRKQWYVMHIRPCAMRPLFHSLPLWYLVAKALVNSRRSPCCHDD